MRNWKTKSRIKGTKVSGQPSKNKRCGWLETNQNHPCKEINCDAHVLQKLPSSLSQQKCTRILMLVIPALCWWFGSFSWLYWNRLSVKNYSLNIRQPNYMFFFDNYKPCIWIKSILHNWKFNDCKSCLHHCHNRNTQKFQCFVLVVWIIHTFKF